MQDSVGDVGVVVPGVDVGVEGGTSSCPFSRLARIGSDIFAQRAVTSRISSTDFILFDYTLDASVVKKIVGNLVTRCNGCRRLCSYLGWCWRLCWFAL